MKLSIRVYGNMGATNDRYTIVFHGRYKHLTDRQQVYLGCNGSPFHPLGIGEFSSADKEIDYPSYSHLGKKLGATLRQALPEDVKRFVRQTAVSILVHDYLITSLEMDNLINNGAGSFSKIPTSRVKQH